MRARSPPSLCLTSVIIIIIIIINYQNWPVPVAVMVNTMYTLPDMATGMAQLQLPFRSD